MDYLTTITQLQAMVAARDREIARLNARVAELTARVERPPAPAPAPVAPVGPAPDLLTLRQVSARLGVGRSTVFKLISEGHLRAVKLSSRMTRVTSASVDAYLESF